MAKKKRTKRKAKTRRKKSTTVYMNGSRVNGLPAKQWVFCQEYIKDLCAKQAAIRAGYSEKTAEQQGWQMLQQDDIKQCIENLLEQRAKRCGVHADKVIWELACIAFSDITDCLTFSDGGVTLKTSTALEEKVRHAIGEVRESISMSGGSISFKMHNKVEALKVLAQHLGMTKNASIEIPEGTAKVMFFPSNGRELPQGE